MILSEVNVLKYYLSQHIWVSVYWSTNMIFGDYTT